MDSKKSFLRPTAASKQSNNSLEGQPGRDHAALILPITVIKVGENVRSELGDLTELTDSIRQHSILQPIVVTKTKNGLELVAGRRRLEAARLAGLTEVPVRIINATDEQIEVLRLVENLQREDLSGPDEIKAVAKLASLFDGNQTELAKALGKSKTYVSQCIKTVELLKDQRVSTSKLSKSALFELANKTDQTQIIQQLANNQKPTVKAIRERSGPLSGGRYVTQAISLRENRKSGAFSLSVNFAPDRTPADTKEKIIKTLEGVINKLRGK